MKGSVVFFDAKKGYGFIKGEDGREAFVHFNDIQMEGFRKLNENQTVNYDLAEGKKGLKAVNVTII